MLAIPADTCPRSPGVLVVQLYSWAARCSLGIRLNLTFSFSGVSSHHSLIANTGCQTSSSDSRIKGLGSRVQARGLSLKGQTLGSRCQTQTLEHRLLQDPRSRLQAMKDQLKTPQRHDPELEVQNPESRSPDSKNQKGRSRSRIQDPRPFCRHERHGSRIQFLHCRPQIPGVGFQNPGFGFGFPPILDPCSLPVPHTPQMPLAGNSSLETQTKVSA